MPRRKAAGQPCESCEKMKAELLSARIEAGALQNSAEYQQGAIREAWQHLDRMAGGCVAQAKAELERMIPSDVLDKMRRTRKPCP